MISTPSIERGRGEGMKAQHTPGPWTHKATASLGPQYVVYSENDKTGADICIVYDWGLTEANARLIAAAPELLAACKEWIAYMYEPQSDHPEAIEQRKKCAIMRAAIAKAEGK